MSATTASRHRVNNSQQSMIVSNNSLYILYSNIIKSTGAQKKHGFFSIFVNKKSCLKIHVAPGFSQYVRYQISEKIKTLYNTK